MIDLRSDTLTTPSHEMREAMANARVGDDVYGEDPDVNELQHRVATMFGKEAGLFVPSGTMGNQIALALHTTTGDEIIADADAHIFHYENAATSVVARAQIHPVSSDNGEMPLEGIEETIRPQQYYYPKTAVIAIENTHNRHGGTMLSKGYLDALRGFAESRNLPVHCDGARIWNAIATGSYTALEFGEYVHSMSVCMSKGAGAPVGSVVVGPTAFIQRARRWRKMLGGGMRQAGVLAAAGLFALDNIVPHLSADNAKALTFAHGIAAIPGVDVDVTKVQTNIVAFRVPGIDDERFVEGMKRHGIIVATIKPRVMRVVFYHQVSHDDVRTAVDAVRQVLLSSESRTTARN